MDVVKDFLTRVSYWFRNVMNHGGSGSDVLRDLRNKNDCGHSVASYLFEDAFMRIPVLGDGLRGKWFYEGFTEKTDCSRLSTGR